MLKYILSVIVFAFVAHLSIAQKHYKITIKLDSSIDPKMIRYVHNDGQTFHTLNDSTHARQVTFKGDYYASTGSLQIFYLSPQGTYYDGNYFFNDKPATIHLYYEPNFNQLLLTKSLINITDLNDSTTNKTFRDLGLHNKEKFLENWKFYEKHKNEFAKNDSLYKVYISMVKATRKRSLAFLRNYSDDYFSFWYFQTNLAQEARNTSPDVAELKELYNYYLTTFPDKIKQSYEGKDLEQAFQRGINPLRIADSAPSFAVETVDGKPISLSSLKGKYVLLDFWATWCGPCMQEIPFIKTLRDKYPPNQLVILGVSRDVDIKPLRKAIKTEKMNWEHYYDKEHFISKLYGVDTFPTLILLDKTGKIIYKSDHRNADIKALPKVLGTLF